MSLSVVKGTMFDLTSVSWDLNPVVSLGFLPIPDKKRKNNMQDSTLVASGSNPKSTTDGQFPLKEQVYMGCHQKIEHPRPTFNIENWTYKQSSAVYTSFDGTYGERERERERERELMGKNLISFVRFSEIQIYKTQSFSWILFLPRRQMLEWLHPSIPPSCYFTN